MTTDATILSLASTTILSSTDEMSTSVREPEIASVLSREQGAAMDRRDRIKGLVNAMADNRDEIIDLLTAAYEARDWRRLGYLKWADYVRAEFGEALARLGREDRRDTTLLLDAVGMSVRAISAVTGMSKSQVAADLAQLSSSGQLPGTEDRERTADVIGLDGKRRARQPAKPAPSAPSTPRRKPLTDAVWAAVYDLEKAADRLLTLTQDDRMAGERTDILERHGSQLSKISRMVWVARQAINGEGQQ